MRQQEDWLRQGMEITVRFTGPLRSLAGRSSLDLALEEGARLGDVLSSLHDRTPASFAEEVLAPMIRGEPSVPLLLLNRELVAGVEALERPVSHGDVVAFVTPMEGG